MAPNVPGREATAALRVALVVMPFANSDRPSLGVGLLKAGLLAAGIDCEVKYFNLTFWKILGAARYQQMSQTLPNTAMAGEWVFSQVYYGQAVSSWDRYEREVLDDPLWGLAKKNRPILHETLALAPMFLRLVFESNDWSRYDLVGFTSTFEQTMASLCLARMIREAHPGVGVALGGANFEAQMGRPYLEHYPFVDYVSVGEADRSFPLLCRRLADARARGQSLDLVELPAGILGRAQTRPPSLSVVGQAAASSIVGESAVVTDDLDALPTPDFSEYFEIAAHAGATPNNPWLSLETSRGCWWGRKRHCTFCGLNGETMTFRRKSAARVLNEIAELQARHGVRPLQFTDNILSHDYFSDLLPRWAEQPEPERKFFEIKANLRRGQVQLLAKAGVLQVQPGVESLDDATLVEMGKGVSAAQNLALLRWCAEEGIEAYWNILYGFPREPEDACSRQLALMRVLTHLPPPTACSLIRLDRFSPNFNQWREHGFTSIAPLTAYSHVFPFSEQTLAELAYFFRYDHPRLDQAVANGRELVRFIRSWREASEAGRRGSLSVEVRNGAATLIEERLDRPAEHRELSAVELAVLLACDGPRKRANAEGQAGAAGSSEEAQEAIERLLSEAVIVELSGSLVCLAFLPPTEQLENLMTPVPPWLRRAR